MNSSINRGCRYRHSCISTVAALPQYGGTGILAVLYWCAGRKNKYTVLVGAVVRHYATTTTTSTVFGTDDERKVISFIISAILLQCLTNKMPSTEVPNLGRILGSCTEVGGGRLALLLLSVHTTFRSFPLKSKIRRNS